MQDLPVFALKRKAKAILRSVGALIKESGRDLMAFTGGLPT